ncbi:MAG: F0F1 ATP synthase subunit delta [Puniceicoccales bacterium]|jgi:F0F1-type ATP synthase delta subunit|nr:F0F1 ATP synthase subunit delta [Puniceicoccales bacterium]
MKTDKRVAAFARKLLQISFNGKGLLCEEKIHATIEALPRSHRTLAILNEYFSLIKREFRRQMLAISSPTELSADAIDSLRQHFERTLGRKFAPVALVDGSLIAGIRVQADDRIFEKSIAGALETLLSAT